MDRFYKMAWKLSFASTYPANNKKMAAVVCRGGSVLQAETNDRPGRHAEARALKPHLNLVDATIYVARTNGKISRPCKKCLDLIKSSGIKRMVYINEHGNLVGENIRYA